MRLIDADEIQKYLEDDNTMNEWCVSQYSADWISSFIENRPTVDIKTEVAREIFAEIEKLISENLREAEDSYHGMRVKGRNATFYEGSKQSLESLSSYIAELENKYIGGVGE